MNYLLWHSVLSVACLFATIVEARLGNVWWVGILATCLGMNVLVVILEMVARS